MRPLDLRIARSMRDLLEPYHLAVVFAPKALSVFHAAGLDRPWSPYYAGRVAPFGDVGTAVVDAVFYHFEPALTALELSCVRGSGLGAEKLLALRLEAVDAGLREALGPELLASPELAEAAELAVEAAAVCAAAPYGRPLGAANAVLPVPDQPHLALWQAATTLREWRGDGHNVALLAAGLDAVEALTSIVATGAERRRSLQPRRGWDDAAWAAGIARLAARGLLTADGELTAAGGELREQVESMTDRLATAPWLALGPERCHRLHELAAPLSTRVAEGMGLRMPTGEFPEA
ncbi:SCO6745 family protein [Streptacidiphilus carbonis]|uniref:SCO6745 family protein n=1 Tax=Streptacidiphilus carbonis TaxID=105422 RepID=UPI0005AB731C|nr:hypothetical protein [Streptacidiphilus carbonis]